MLAALAGTVPSSFGRLVDHTQPATETHHSSTLATTVLFRSVACLGPVLTRAFSGVVLVIAFVCGVVPSFSAAAGLYALLGCGRMRCAAIRRVIRVIYPHNHCFRVSDGMALNTNSSAIRDEVEQGEVFVDERESEHYAVVAVGKNGVTLARENREYYIPHSIFARWYTSPDIERIDDRSNIASEENSQR